jgi:hypothetical protein
MTPLRGLNGFVFSEGDFERNRDVSPNHPDSPVPLGYDWLRCIRKPAKAIPVTVG